MNNPLNAIEYIKAVNSYVNGSIKQKPIRNQKEEIGRFTFITDANLGLLEDLLDKPKEATRAQRLLNDLMAEIRIRDL